MRLSSILAIATTCACAACGASYPAPTQRMADTISAQRSAQEIGANSIPQGQLHLKLADEQLAQAKSLMAKDENRRAEFMLVRAKGDAELALALARASNAKKEAQAATEKAATVAADNQRALQPASPPPIMPMTPTMNPSQGGPQ